MADSFAFESQILGKGSGGGGSGSGSSLPTDLLLHFDAQLQAPNTDGAPIFGVIDRSGSCGWCPANGGGGITWSATGGPNGKSC